VGVLGGGAIGLMLARLLVLEGRDVVVCDRHPERRAQAEALGARSAPQLGSHELVFEAVGRVEAWEQAFAAARPGGTVVLVGGCPAGTEVTLPAAPLHYAELDVRGAFHHHPAEVDRALALLAQGALNWRALAAGPIGLEDLQQALSEGNEGPARKWIVVP
jgi:L-iditol 2-dehydrogenase